VRIAKEINMAHFRQALLLLDQKEYLLTPGKINSFEHFYVDFQRTDEADGGTRYAMFIHPKQDVLVEKIEVEFSLPLPAQGRLSRFGLRSSDDSQLAMGMSDKQPVELGLLKNDPFLPKIPQGKGLFHSWSFMGLHADSKSSVWAVSLNESVGFTTLVYDTTQELLQVRKDVGRGLRMTHSFPAMDFYIGPNLPVPEGTLPPFKAIALLANVAQATTLAQKNHDDALPFTHVVVSNGWQPHHGDWLANREVQAIPAQLKGNGLQAGIVLSPFAAGTASELARRNPDWLLQHNGRPLEFTAANGSKCYALDIYNGAAREYLNGVFHLLADRCGYTLFLLEDLYAASLAPKAEKTRGQMMHEAAQFLRQAAGSAKLVACQVPMGTAAGSFDAIMAGQPGIGSKSGQWQIQKNTNGQLTIDALLAVQQLRNRYWSVASQPVALWPTPKPNTNSNAQHTWLQLNALQSDILLVEGDVWAYPPELRCELEAGLDLHRAEQVRMTDAASSAALFQFSMDHKLLSLRTNWGAKKANAGGIDLMPFETL
jgi:hypothetical protein